MNSNTNSVKQKHAKSYDKTDAKSDTKSQINISHPIAIPTSSTSPSSNSNANQNQYSLKQNCFNPNKSSPPSSWNYRLMQRISVEMPARSP
jgi:hypothetical protein